MPEWFDAYPVLPGLPGVERQPLTALFAHLDLGLLDLMTLTDLLELSHLETDAALAAVLGLLFARLQEGSLCLDMAPQALEADLSRGPGTAPARRWIEQFFKKLTSGAYAALITRDKGHIRPLVLDETRTGSLLYFEKCFRHENRIKTKLPGFLGSMGPDVPVIDDPQALIRQVFAPDHTIRLGPGGPPITRDPLQEKALAMALGKRFTIVSGGPGTGKTSLLVNLLRCFALAPIPVDQMIVAAPTGRATQRIMEALEQSLDTLRHPLATDVALKQITAGTLHKILRYSRSRRAFLHNAANPLPARVIVVDEISMVDVAMMASFLEAVDPERTRLILMGDKDQLPSVEAGAILADLIPNKTQNHIFQDHFIELTSVFRAGEHLRRLAREINDGTMPVAEPATFEQALALPRDRWAFIAGAGARHLAAGLALWAETCGFTGTGQDSGAYVDTIRRAEALDAESLSGDLQGRALLTRLFGIVERARILTLVRQGPFGCVAVNRLVARMILAARGVESEGTEHDFSGAVIIITRNDYRQGLFNGDVGLIIRSAAASPHAWFKRGGMFAFFPVEALPEFEPAFAMTVHKSQGSEFEDVLIVLPEEPGHRLLSREIIYTAVTRAKQRVLIHGTRQVLESALARKIKRTSGLTW